MSAGVTFDDLYFPFDDRSDRPETEPIPEEFLPEPYRTLLVHNGHMTATIEEYFGEKTDLIVLEAQEGRNWYARKILLALRSSGKVVQFGIVLIDLDALEPVVRQEIIDRRTPLGRILMNHNILCEVNPVEYFRVDPTPAICGWFGLHRAEPSYGRLGIISTDDKPVIRVAEILAPAAPITQVLME